MSSAAIADGRAFARLGPRIGRFLVRRLAETAGMVVILLGGLLALALASYHSTDPSLLHATTQPPRNLLGWAGSMIADPLLRGLGVAAALLPLALAAAGIRVILRTRLPRILLAAFMLVPALGALAPALALLAPPEAWPFASGLGGVAGDRFLTRIMGSLPALPRAPASAIEGLVAGLLVVIGAGFATCACGIQLRRPAQWLLLALRLGLVLVLELGQLAATLARRLAAAEVPKFQTPAWLHRSPARPVDPEEAEYPEMLEEEPAPLFQQEPIAPRPPVGRAQPVARTQPVAPAAPPARRRAPAAAAPAQPKPRAAPRRKKSDLPLLPEDGAYDPPALDLLTEADSKRPATVSAAVIEEMSEALQGVLDDYKIGGSIVGARPGPAVTLFELEPPPGLKASKIEGLADDIARSMGVVSTRISTIPESKAIGIEIPNHRRQPVLLREILDSPSYTDGSCFLPLALGKNIQGQPVVADLEKMPHLLIAGTTGSGKSVSVNAMILSLLYRLSPEDCRMIMIDPKMLEFSVYDDIPHLLTPVVTDPRTAVSALKWVVREMEERYRLMSKIGVRNISSFNARAAQAIKKSEPLTRKMQTGFDPETGKPVHEEVEIGVRHLPRIVVVVDEMADLMMVAGKEIEACVQRLAQMARASGIHLIMATQRPSVDVITGTIKANFPTRISFCLSSKIDSRTILNAQGAEKLLGKGDMLYQGAGGRLSRIHGPFVSDEEIEDVVNHLKSLGPPDYVSDVTVAPEDSDPLFGTGGGEEGDLYSQAVEIVARDRKASTSYLQRKLEIGYNRAAKLMEQLEEAGVVSSANHAGKREILIGEVQ